MTEYEFVIEKIQTATVKESAEGQEELGEVLERICNKSDEQEIEFSEPRHSLKAVFKNTGKISQLIWQRPSS